MARPNDNLSSHRQPPARARRWGEVPLVVLSAAACCLGLSCAVEPEGFVCEGGRCDGWQTDEGAQATCEDGRPRDPYEPPEGNEHEWTATELPDPGGEVNGALGDASDVDWAVVMVEGTHDGSISPWVTMTTEPGDVDPSNLELCVGYWVPGGELGEGEWLDIPDYCVGGYEGWSIDGTVPLCCNQDFSYENQTTTDVALEVNRPGVMAITVRFHNRTDSNISELQGICAVTYRLEYGF